MENLNFEELPLARLRALRHDLRELLETKGWVAYRFFVEQTQIILLKDIVLKPLESVDGALPQEYLKGKYAALDQILEGVPLWVESLDRVIEVKAAAEAAQNAKEPASHDRIESDERPASRAP